MRILFCSFGIFFLVCLASFLTFDAILRILHERHYAEWEKAGKPFGFFFRPEPWKFYSKLEVKSWLAFQRMCFSMNFWTPAWMKNESRALNLLMWYRVLGGVGLLIWLILVYCLVYQI